LLAKAEANRFGITREEERILNDVAMRAIPVPPKAPLICRSYELVMVNGPARKSLIAKEFAEGVISAIDFGMA
jgi:cyanate lyase